MRAQQPAAPVAPAEGERSPGVVARVGRYAFAVVAWLFVAALASIGVSADAERPNHNARNARGIYLWLYDAYVES